MNIVALIPARSGSKNIKHKNIRLMNGKPMIAYSIEQALNSKYVTRVIVSTDSEDYRDISIKYGAEVPFLRPDSISGDRALDIDTFLHAANWLKLNENYDVDIFVHLRPTHPIRDSKDIDNMIEKLLSDAKADSIRSVSPAEETPYKMWFMGEQDILSPVLTCPTIPEAYNSPRQYLPRVFTQNACIDVIRAETITKKMSMTGDKILGYMMDYDFDIDSEEDFLKAEKYQLLQQVYYEKKKVKVVCDIDGVIACKTFQNDYSLATPMQRNIDIINSLHERGHYIVLFTARGYATGIDWKEVTRTQMETWQVKYDELLFGKPDADIYIDDKFFEIDALK